MTTTWFARARSGHSAVLGRFTLLETSLEEAHAHL